MTTEYANILGINWLKHSSGEPNFALCLITFEVDSTVTSGDTVKLGDATHGTRNGVVTKETLVAMLQDDRRDGQSVTLGTGTASDGLILLAEPGNDGGTVGDFYIKSAATSDTGANITFVPCDSTGTNQSSASSGITTRPFTVCVSVTLSAVGT